MSEATHNLSTSIGDVISKVSSVTNAVSFLYTDILEVSSDLSLNGSGDNSDCRRGSHYRSKNVAN